MKQVVVGLRGTLERVSRERDQARRHSTELRRALQAVVEHKHGAECSECSALISEVLLQPVHA